MTIRHTSKSFSNDGQLPGFLAIQKQNKSSSASGPHDTDLFYSENNREWLEARAPKCTCSAEAQTWLMGLFGVVFILLHRNKK